ncbi:type II toxin-antitoxin system RelE/ParE family toxin [Methylobacterium sp. E-016]|uniref:type II toxin-antitoxin system RelE/ParE family toxin n=1 Tax=Methylobacterium sp. E-016 TaxID=2836556 RepID=UPI001FBA5453|nr:type II toxin-antitoxin system RelE/ParE family toxin [Methylobacterium sp. E-016]MCJ2074794.1 type II toxin-antitoxin system RelE/ParE family toxin [Methylobacterium sp. E-016]
MTDQPEPNRRIVVWVASSRKDIRDMPPEVRREFGQAIDDAELGGKHPHAKPLKGIEAVEVVTDFDGDTFRAVYTVKLEGYLYVLDAFQKKSTTGRKTAVVDIDRIKRRLAAAKENHRMRTATQGTG